MSSPTEEDPLVVATPGSKKSNSSSSTIEDLAKSPQDPMKKKGRVLLAGTVLALIAWSSLAILSGHSSHFELGAKGGGEMPETDFIGNLVRKTKQPMEFFQGI